MSVQKRALLDGQYALGVAASPSSSVIAVHASQPDAKIHLFDRSLVKTGTRVHCAQGTSILKYARIPAISGQASHLLSAGFDGRLVVWDDRSPQEVLAFIDDRASKGITSFDILSDHNLIVTGTALKAEDASILYWDPRFPAAPMYAHTSTHSDDVTALQFNVTSATPLLLSASVDGLLSVSNPLEQDEDEAILNVSNTGSSIARAGWSHSGQHVWMTTDMETASVWTAELDQIQDLGDVRKKHLSGFETNYVVDVLSLGSDICLALGSNNGDVALVSLAPSDPTSWTTRAVLRGTHTDIVRSLHLDTQAKTLLTGGEDSIVALWRIDSLSEVPDVQMEDVASAPSIGETRRKRTHDEQDGRNAKRQRG